MGVFGPLCSFSALLAMHKLWSFYLPATTFGGIGICKVSCTCISHCSVPVMRLLRRSSSTSASKE